MEHAHSENAMKNSHRSKYSAEYECLFIPVFSEIQILSVSPLHCPSRAQPVLRK